jgi:hypothetical protein
MKLFLGVGIYKELSRGIIHKIYYINNLIDQKVRALKKLSKLI